MKKLVSIVAILAVSVLALAGCGKNKDLDRPAEDVFKEAYKNSQEIKSASYDLQVEMDMTPAQESEAAKEISSMNMNFTADGLFSMFDLENPQFSMKLDGDFQINGNTEEQTMGGPLDFEIRVNKDNLYALLSKVPDFGEEVPAAMLDLFIGQWFRIELPEGTLKEFIELSAVSAADEQELTEEQKKIKELVDNTNYFGKIEYVGNEKVAGENAYKFETVVDMNKVKDLMIEINNIQGNEIPEAELAELESFWSKDFPATVWISIDDMLIVKWEAEFDMESPEGDLIEMNFTYEISDVNENLEIEIPEDAKEFDPATYLGILGGGLGGGGLGGDVQVPTQPDFGGAAGTLPEGFELPEGVNLEDLPRY